MIRRQIVATARGQVHVRTSQGVGRPLVALHMSPLSSEMWLPLMERMTRPVVALDRLGFGCSDPPPSTEMAMDDYAETTLEVLDQLGIEDPVDVIGEHTGSVEAVALARMVPERIRALCLISLPAYTAEELAERAETRAAPPDPPDEAGEHLLARWRRRLAHRSPPYDLEHLHRVTVQELASAGPDVAYRAVFRYPMAAALAELDVPTVVLAPHDDLAEQTRRARAHLPPNAVYVDLPHLGLDIFHEAPDEMAALVAHHLADPQTGGEPT